MIDEGITMWMVFTIYSEYLQYFYRHLNYDTTVSLDQNMEQFMHSF